MRDATIGARRGTGRSGAATDVAAFPGIDVRRVDAVVVGASAGGVEALGELLPALPARLRARVLVVLHLARDQPSLLTAIFARRCAVPVREAEDKDPADPGVVCFAPPDYHLLVDKGPRLALSADPLVHFSRPSIDVLFESAADHWRERLLGIVLTGARAQAMPEAALARVPDAAVADLAQIAALLRTLPVTGASA